MTVRRSRRSRKAAAGLPDAAQREKLSMPRPIGGHTRLRTTPAATAASADRIGTDRFPEKNPRYGGKLHPEITVEQPPGDRADQNAAEDPRLDRGNAHDRLRLVTRGTATTPIVASRTT